MTFFEQSNLDKLSYILKSITRVREPHTFKDSMAASIPKTPGVYVICATHESSKECTTGLEKLLIKPYYVVYAGNSQNLNRRLGEHLKDRGSRALSEYLKSSSSRARLEFWTYECSKNEIGSVESILISTLAPLTNIRQGERIEDEQRAIGYRE